MYSIQSMTGQVDESSNNIVLVASQSRLGLCFSDLHFLHLIEKKQCQRAFSSWPEFSVFTKRSTSALLTGSEDVLTLHQKEPKCR